MKQFLLLSTALVLGLAGSSQNVGIGVANPQQKLHVGGTMRVDAMAAAGNGIITTNTDGDLLRLNFSGNSDEVLKGNGTFGTVSSSSLPAGAMVGSASAADSNLLNAGFSLYGELPTLASTYIERLAGASTQYLEIPTYDKGNPTAVPPPSPRSNACAVWSGSEMLVWGGAIPAAGYNFTFFNNGKKYNPASDTWTPISMVNAPRKRGYATSVWTGTEMIVWGGDDSLVYGNTLEVFFTNTGGRYNPATNTWTSMQQAGAPTGRHSAPAIWTGTQMLIWGGARDTGFLSTGSRYNPVSNSWLAMSNVNAPLSEGAETKMFWDASNGQAIILGKDNTGGKYNPVTNTWTAMATVPGYYDRHSAVWTGTQLVVYNRQAHSVYKYTPSTNTWTTTVVTGNFPGNSITIMGAVWTGFEIMYLTYYITDQGIIEDNIIYRYNIGTNAFAISNYLTFNSVLTSGVNFLMAGSMLLKWGGEISSKNSGFSEYKHSSQGARIYLNAGIAYTPYYYKSNINNIIYLYKKN